MAIDLSAVASAADYRARNGRVSISDDDLLDDLLLGTTRVVESRCGVAPGMFLPQTALTFTFDAHGGSRLYLKDSSGVYLLRSITADSLAIDTDADGSYDDYTLDTADAWVKPGPVNNGTLGRPYSRVDLLPLSGATITAWPSAAQSVQITGNWGWAACPEALKNRVIQIVREMIDAHHAGAAMVTTNVEEFVQVNPSARSIMAMIEREYNYRGPKSS